MKKAQEGVKPKTRDKTSVLHFDSNEALKYRKYTKSNMFSFSVKNFLFILKYSELSNQNTNNFTIPFIFRQLICNSVRKNLGSFYVFTRNGFTKNTRQKIINLGR